MLIAHISDTHITSPGNKTYGVAPMAENLARCVEHISQMVPRPDVVFHSGDVTNAGTAAEVRHAVALLEKLDCPVFMVPGNHDNGRVLSDECGSTICPMGDYVVDDFPLRLIGMDSTDPGKPGGKITTAQAGWLETQLSSEPEKPTLIFMHHPPVKCGVRESDRDGFVGADLLGEVVGKYNNIERILCGHIHLLIHARWQGTVVTTAPSTGMQLGLDLTMEKEPAFSLTEPGYLLHDWTQQQQLITHTVSLARGEGPYLFEEQG
ncbi:3',5'-cyclic-nucleotide phosphodiesterase [hydrothermal vent metagenome]|uniref:3',5'-cyclic-nucleotide phosphodiesterase n=1 Tax=hydrothermal vent metagenome TaxID=652676 RepID=A0A3B0RKU8_9ZZZZ